MSRYLPALDRVNQEFHRTYRYATYDGGEPITMYHRRAFLKLIQSNRKLDRSPFSSRQMIEALSADGGTYDYFPPGLEIVLPDMAFPNMVEGNRRLAPTPFLRREIPHKWYVDIRSPKSGFVTRDEALILYNTAKLFRGRPALEIGCWLGWSACHLALGGVLLDMVDPLLADSLVMESVKTSLETAGVADRCRFHAVTSPVAISDIATSQSPWGLVFIDGNHEAPGPVEDALIAAEHADQTAIILFHDLAFPDVAKGLDVLRDRGWNTMIYLTMQMMGVAWRGSVQPVRHQPDPSVTWNIPAWLANYRIST